MKSYQPSRRCLPFLSQYQCARDHERVIIPKLAQVYREELVRAIVVRLGAEDEADAQLIPPPRTPGSILRNSTPTRRQRSRRRKFS